MGAELIAQEIAKIARAMQTMSESRLKRDAIVALIHERSKVARKTIEIILNNLEHLELTWLKPKKK